MGGAKYSSDVDDLSSGDVIDSIHVNMQET